MVSLYQSNNNLLPGVNNFLADEEAELAAAKETDQLKKCLAGSTIMCLNPFFVQIKNSKGEWIKI